MTTDTPDRPARTTRAMLDAALAERDQARAELTALTERYEALHTDATRAADEARLAGQETVERVTRGYEGVLDTMRHNLAVAALLSGVELRHMTEAARSVDGMDDEGWPADYPYRRVQTLPTGGLL